MKKIASLLVLAVLWVLFSIPASAVTLCNNAWMTTVTTGTGAITLGSALNGYQSFDDCGITNGQVVRYRIFDGAAWELGRGTYTTASTTLTRTVLESSNSDAAISLSGAATVIITPLTADLPSESTPIDTTVSSSSHVFALEAGTLSRYPLFYVRGRHLVTDYGAVCDNVTDDTAAFNSAIAANPGGEIFIPYTSTGCKLTGNITFGGSGKAKTIIGESYVSLNFTGLSTSTDAVTMNFDTLASITGVTIDLGNSTSSYTNGRDALRLNGGEWPVVDVQLLNAGRDAFHYEAIANGGWLENLRANIRAFNMGRDAINITLSDFDAIFANELNFENFEARQWKRNAVYAAVDTTAYAAAKISNISFPKLNLDASRALVDLTSQDVFYFAYNAAAPSGGLYDAWMIGNGGIENLTALMSGYIVSPQTGATVRNLKVEGPIIIYNIQAPSQDPSYRIANYQNLTEPYWIFDTVSTVQQSVFSQASVKSTNSGASAGPGIICDRDSASPAVSDNLCQISMWGRDSAGNATLYTDIITQITDPTNGSEDAFALIRSIVAGTVTDQLFVKNGIYTSGATGSAQGTGTINAINFFDDGANINTLYQGLDADLTTWAGLTPSANAQSLVTAADYAAMRALLDLEAGIDFLSLAAIAAAYQALDSDLTSWAAITRASGFDTFTATPSSANLDSLVTDDVGSGSAVFATSGTFTPALKFAGASTGMTYNYAVGNYTVTGNQFTLWIDFNLTAKGSSTGAATITGLPACCTQSSQNGATAPAYSTGMLLLVDGVIAIQGASASTITLWTGSAAGVVQATDANFTNTSRISITITGFL